MGFPTLAKRHFTLNKGQISQNVVGIYLIIVQIWQNFMTIILSDFGWKLKFSSNSEKYSNAAEQWWWDIIIHTCPNFNDKSPISRWFFPQQWAAWTSYISSYIITTDSCIAIFHKYCFCAKHGDIITNLTLRNLWGILLICQNTTMRVYGAWIKRHCVLCSKTYNTSCISLVCDKPLGAPPSVKQVYLAKFS